MNVRIIETEDVSKLQAYIDKHGHSLLACDIETTALTVGKGKIICLAVGAVNKRSVVVYYPKDLADLRKVSIPNAVFHNSQFDKRWLVSYGAEVDVVWDTMLMAHLLDENSSVGLKVLGQRLLGLEDWAEENIESLESVPRVQITKYVAQDVYVTKELYKYQVDYITSDKLPGEDPLNVMRNITLPAADPLTEMENNRLPIRMDRLSKVREHVEKRLSRIDRKLDASIPEEEVIPEYLKTRRGINIKWGSTNWTRWWLYDYQGAVCPTFGKPTKAFPEGAPSLSSETLSKINHPAAELLKTRSALNKLLTGFLIPLEERAVDGRVSTSFRLTGTVTGRLSSSSPAKDNPGINSQQIPRDKMIRNLFGEKGLHWIEADYSQLELRVAAVLADDPTMLGLFEEDGDIHQHMAERLVQGGEVTKEHRTLAKGVNFGFLYGMQSKHFANYLQQSYGVTVSQEEGNLFREEYFKTFDRLLPWHRKQRDEALRYGGVRNVFGRFRHLPKVYDPDFWVAEMAFRQAINAPVQSTGSDFMLISIRRIWENKELRKMGAKLITTVHDSVCLTVPPQHSEEAGHIIKGIMETADDICPKRFPLKADITVSRVWGGEPLNEF